MKRNLYTMVTQQAVDEVQLELLAPQFRPGSECTAQCGLCSLKLWLLEITEEDKDQGHPWWSSDWESTF